MSEKSHDMEPEIETNESKLLDYLTKGKFDFAVKIKNLVSDDYLNSDAVQRTLKTQLFELLDNGLTDHADALLDDFSLSQEKIQEAAEEAFFSTLAYGSIYDADKILSKYHLSDDIVLSERSKNLVMNPQKRMIVNKQALSYQMQQLLSGSPFIQEHE